jgi:hypothetical protein
MPLATTPSGTPVTCDGCGAFVEDVTDAMRHPVPTDIAIANYGRTGVEFVVCAPGADGTQPCLDLALLAEELYDTVRCRTHGCDDTRCRPAG